MLKKILLFFALLYVSLGHSATESLQRKKKSSSFFNPTLARKISAFLIGVGMALSTEALAYHYAPHDGLVRLMTRLFSATGSTLLLPAFTKSETFFDFFGIGYDTVVIASIVRFLAANLKKETFKTSNVLDVITLLSSIMDIRSRIISPMPPEEVIQLHITVNPLTKD